MKITPKNTRRQRLKVQIVGLQLDGLNGISVIPSDRFSDLSLIGRRRYYRRAR